MTRFRVVVVAFFFLALADQAAGVEYCSNSLLLLPGGGGTDGPASPYPSTIYVFGAPTGGTITMSLHGFSHSFPDDVDLLLVSPTDKSMIVQSDAFGNVGVSNLHYALADHGRNDIDAQPLLPTIHEVGNFDSGADVFPAPAPANPQSASPTGNATLAGVFGGDDPTGTWQLFAMDDTANNAGIISHWCLRFEEPQLRISELRWRGSNGANDEFIELHNIGAQPLTVEAFDGSEGWSVVASDGQPRCTIANGTVVPPYGHYLCVNNQGYSLSPYPAGPGNYTSGDATYFTDIADNAGIALFGTSNPSNWDAGRRIDAVGPAAEPNELYKEGAGYPTLLGISSEWSLYRDTCGKHGAIGSQHTCPFVGLTFDSQDNAADILFVDPDGNDLNAGQRLGAPGPQNSTSPTFGIGSLISRRLDQCSDERLPPNLVFDATPDFFPFGTIVARRTVTNLSQATVTKLRFRIIDQSTFPAPAGTADLRAFSSQGWEMVTVDRAPCGSGTSTLMVVGTALEQLPFQPNGGGFNSTLRADLPSSLYPGASIDVQFRFGLQQAGLFHVTLVPEGIGAGGGPGDLIVIEGCTPVACPAGVFADDFED